MAWVDGGVGRRDVPQMRGRIDIQAVEAQGLHELARRPRPLGDQPIDRRHLRIARRARRKGLHLLLQRLRLVVAQAHGFAQVACPPRAAHLRQGLCRSGRHRVVGELPIEVVAGQQQAARDFRHAAHALAAVHAREAAAPGLGVAVAQVDAAALALDVEARDAQVGQRVQLARLADAVLVHVLPDPQLAIGRVRRVDHAIAVAVLPCQGFVAVGIEHALARLRPLAQRLVAEQLATRIDQAVAVAVQHHDAVVALDPARGVPGAIAVVVEEDGTGGVDAYRFDAVAVQVQDQGVAWSYPVSGLKIEIVG